MIVCVFCLAFITNLECNHTIPAHFENGENITDRSPVHTKTAHFLPLDFENSRFCKWNSNRHILKTALVEHSKMMKTEHFSTTSKRG